jgi:hypothetical protein
MTPPISVICVYRQEQASSTAELWLLLKAMRYMSPMYFNSMTGMVGGCLSIGMSPLKIQRFAAKHSTTEEKTCNDTWSAPLCGLDQRTVDKLKSC